MLGITTSSMRIRFIFLVLILVSLLIVIALYAERTATITVSESAQITQDQRDVGWSLNELTDALYGLMLNVYRAAIAVDEVPEFKLTQNLEELTTQADILLSLPAVQNAKSFREPALELRKTIKKLSAKSHSLLQMQSNVELRYPAMPIMLYQLQPTNAEFKAALTTAIEETKANISDPQQQAIYNLFIELRYLWAQQVSSVRVFVANRLGAFGPPFSSMAATENDRQLFSQEVEHILTQLDKMSKAGKLGFVQADAVVELKRLHVEYENTFRAAAQIYRSDNWRTDRIILKEGIDPTLSKAWQLLTAIQNRLNTLSQNGISQSAATTDTISNFVWVVLGIVFMLLLASYVAFEHIIRRPITQVARALEAEGRGETYLPESNLQLPETKMLVKSFSKMRNQIRSRQLRLEAILNNAGEGIVTITTDGIIESFNNAAAKLFSYPESEVIGRSVSMLLPASFSLNYQDTIEALLANPDHEIFQNEQEIIGRRQNGSIFPMSLRLGRIEIEGRVIFTALVSDISERKAMVDRLTLLAERDSLTGLYNRHYLMDELTRIVNEKNTKDYFESALLYIDLDNFKFVNDTLGHLAGDSVLKDVANILKTRARSTDLLARLGGDEFAILLYDVNKTQSRIAADHYRRQLADFVFRYDGNGVDIGCSIGVALLESDVNTKEELLSRADLACHIAKRSGRNRIHMYEYKDKQNVATMSTDMGWARKIKRSIENNQFIMAKQPIINVQTNEISGYEVLLRMRDEKSELVMPAGFLSSADRFGLSVDVDRWVIKNGIHMISLGEAEDLSYSINLSPKSIGDPTILRLIQDELANTGIDTSNIVFEITETGAIKNIASAVKFLTELRNLGFKTALDDFGVGYSSFSYLKDFPVDYIKIDGSFIDGLLDDKLKQAIVKSMTDVAHAIKIKTVAEFIEDQATLEFLAKIGIDYGQGYHIGKPEIMRDMSANVVYIH